MDLQHTVCWSHAEYRSGDRWCSPDQTGQYTSDWWWCSIGLLEAQGGEPYECLQEINFSDVTSASLHLKWPSTRLYVQLLAKTNSKENIKAPHYCSLDGGIHRYSRGTVMRKTFPWWRHQMEIFSSLLALCEGNSSVTGGFPSQRPLTRSFDICLDLPLNKRLSKLSRRRWFETPSWSLWCHYDTSHDVNRRQS